MQNQIYFILNDMSGHLSVPQMKQLQGVLLKRLGDQEPQNQKVENVEYVEMFLSAKQIEGCSERTIEYYKTTILCMLDSVKTPIRQMTTEILREYLVEYQKRRNCSKVTIDNIRRNLSSFFSWLEEEDHIIKSPIRRIHKVKTGATVKGIISDESIEMMRDGCSSIRDKAIVDILYSTGMRVGELVNLDITDIDLEEREGVVYGKGNKQRKIYFDARTKINIQKYLEEREDENKALFVSLNAPHNRLNIMSSVRLNDAPLRTLF